MVVEVVVVEVVVVVVQVVVVVVCDWYHLLFERPRI